MNSSPAYDFVDSKPPLDQKKQPIYNEARLPSQHSGSTAFSTSSLSSAASTSSSLPNATRKFNIHYDNLKWRKATIFDITNPTTKTPLYRVELHLRNPELIMYPFASDPKSPRRSQASLHCLTSRIDVHVSGRNIELLSRGMFKDGYTYRSPARNGQKMTWLSKSAMKYFSLVCEDERGNQVARFSLACWSLRNVGSFEVVGEGFANGTADGEMEELFMTGLSVMQQRYNTYNATLGASAASGAAAAAAG